MTHDRLTLETTSDQCTVRARFAGSKGPYSMTADVEIGPFFVHGVSIDHTTSAEPTVTLPASITVNDALLRKIEGACLALYWGVDDVHNEVPPPNES